MPFTQEFIESLIKQNQIQLEQIEKLNKTIEELTPSSDGLKKKPATKSFRGKSGKKPG